MSEKLVKSLEDIERYGRRWERQVDLDQRYLPPPPAKKMRVQAAVFVGTTASKQRVAAVQKEEIASEAQRSDENREAYEKIRSNCEEEEREEETSAVDRESEARDKMISVCGMQEVRSISRGREFRGTCYVYHRIGHRASACPQSICFGCHQRGHFARDCPQRDKTEHEKCQFCEKPGFTVKTFPTCAPL